MELRHLRYFLAVAREGNVTRAAASLHVTQPTLSRQLADLEQELGRELLVRESRGVALTDDGMLLRKRAEEIVALADRTEREMMADDSQIEGDVWVGGGETRTMRLVAQAMQSIAQSHPGIRLRLHSGNADDVIERVDKGLLDFGVIISRTPETRFESIELPAYERWGVLVRNDDPLAGREIVSLDDLSGRRLIVSNQPSDAHQPMSEVEQMLGALSSNVVATYTLLYNASLLVEQGFGIALCLDGIIATGPGTPFAFVPTELQPAVRTHLIWKRFQPQSRAAAQFLREVSKVCAEQEA
ncbi:MAG: LysR family transcriptional regulator [Atopobiaceae bacterium]|nr:LysR family transcriptional regulator [Atopobiaceae bacterium]